MIFDAFTLLIRGENVANYALLRYKTFSLKIWLWKFFDKYHVCAITLQQAPKYMHLCTNISNLFSTWDHVNFPAPKFLGVPQNLTWCQQSPGPPKVRDCLLRGGGVPPNSVKEKFR